MSKWVPQWKKDQEIAEIAKKQHEVELVKGLEITEDNFPLLGKTLGPSKVVVWDKKFSDLALEWKTETDKRLEEEKIQKEFANSQVVNGTHPPKMFKLPQFTNKHRYVEEEEEEEKAISQEASNPEEEGWTLVDKRKIRRKKTFEEVVNRPPTPDEGAWNEDGPAEHETCWDERP